MHKWGQISSYHSQRIFGGIFTYYIVIVREPAILLIKWLRPKGLKVCSYVVKYAEFKNQTLKKSAGTQKCYARRNIPGGGAGGREFLKLALK